ncbi:MAG: ATP-binding protein, partial [Eubacteriales bacterium]
MKQGKKIFTKLCLNNWGGVSHKVMEFHEYVNLFSGKSGSGKSTVMDALQVILYGSCSANFLNKAAEDGKNKRSVLGYLRGEQKDGSANRANMDFCSSIVLEIKDTGTGIVNCVGLTFEVRKADTDLKKYTYFSHSGKMPQDKYLNKSGIPYTIREMKQLIEERSVSEDNRGRGDVNRTYPTKESYLNTLNESIMGSVDGSRFITMEKSAIALRMTNGTGQFIRDYMFPKSTSDTIRQMSEQLGAYNEIKSQIEDLKERIEGLQSVKKYGQSLLGHQIKQLEIEKTIKYMDVYYTEQCIVDKKSALQDVEQEKTKLDSKKLELREQKKQIEEELREVLVALQSSDLGTKLNALEELNRRGEILDGSYDEWKRIVEKLHYWEQDAYISDFVSNPMRNRIAEFSKGHVSEELCATLCKNIADTREILEEEYDEYNSRKKAVGTLLQEKQQLVEDMKNNRKTYPENLMKARKELSSRLSMKYGRTIAVHIFADLFDIREEEWKNAVEGRLGALKLALVTEPQYAHDAAVLFREMKQYEFVNLIQTKRISEEEQPVEEHALYEAVTTEEKYIDGCLRRYLGRVMKCESIKDLEHVYDGVTKDCYAYSNFMFRHFKKKDYTIYACIGTKVSKVKLSEYEEEILKLSKEYAEIISAVEAIKKARNFETLEQEASYLVRLSHTQNELEKLVTQKSRLEFEIKELQEGECRLLQEKAQHLEKDSEEAGQAVEENDTKLAKITTDKIMLEADIRKLNENLEGHLMGYSADASIEASVQEIERKQFGTVKNRKIAEVIRIKEAMESDQEQLEMAREAYVFKYPNCGFQIREKSNEAYEKQLESYERDYEENYLHEFEKQAKLVQKSLRENVLATIHGDIKAAKRHANSINRMLRDTNFSDSTYQIKIDAAKDENGQFYEMLMAEELDSKNIYNDGFEGQLSLGEDTFYEKYEHKIQLLLNKFMPSTKEDAMTEQRQKEMEWYSDYRNYLSFSMFEQFIDEEGKIR